PREHDGGFFGKPVERERLLVIRNLAAIGFIAQRAHAVLYDIGQAVERIQLAAAESVFLDGAVEQQPAPSVRQAVVENAKAPVENHLGWREYPCSQRQLDRRDLDARVNKRRIVFEQDLTIAPGKTADLLPGSHVQINGQQFGGDVGHLIRPFLRVFGRDRISSSDFLANPRPSSMHTLSKSTRQSSTSEILSSDSRAIRPVLSNRFSELQLTPDRFARPSWVRFLESRRALNRLANCCCTSWGVVSSIDIILSNTWPQSSIEPIYCRFVNDASLFCVSVIKPIGAMTSSRLRTVRGAGAWSDAHGSPRGCASELRHTLRLLSLLVRPQQVRGYGLHQARRDHSRPSE